MSEELYNPEDTRSKEALARQLVWEYMGHPVAASVMKDGEYNRQYRQRDTFYNRPVFEQASKATRTCYCHACLKEEQYGRIVASRLFITVDDDPMTVFAAMGRAMCHNCGFEEYWPLKHDPRMNLTAGLASQDPMTATQIAMRQQMAANQLAQMSQKMGQGLQNQAAQAAYNMGQMGMGPLVKPPPNMPSQAPEQMTQTMYDKMKKLISP